MKLAIRNLEDVSDFEKLSLTDFSYSRMDTYKMCPSKYFYTYIQKEPRLFGEAAVLGNIVHSVLEDNVSATDVLDFTKLQEAYVNEIATQDPDNKIKPELINTGKEILDEFFDQYAETKFDVLHKEYGFKFVLGSYLISGYIDRIDSWGEDGVKIIDYKTGKVDKNDVILKTWQDLTKEIGNDKIIQILAYAFMYQPDCNGLEMEAGIISFKNLKSGFLPFNLKTEIGLEQDITPEIMESYLEEIVLLLNTIFNSELPFEENK